MKQELQDSEIGTINGKKVICQTLNPNTKCSACRKCIFDKERMTDYCDHVACTPSERKDKTHVYFEGVK
jgi:hypothetical protein